MKMVLRLVWAWSVACVACGGDEVMAPDTSGDTDAETTAPDGDTLDMHEPDTTPDSEGPARRAGSARCGRICRPSR